MHIFVNFDDLKNVIHKDLENIFIINIGKKSKNRFLSSCFYGNKVPSFRRNHPAERKNHTRHKSVFLKVEIARA